MPQKRLEFKEIFKIIDDRYYNPKKFERVVRKTKYVKYKITFKGGKTKTVVMTDAQYHGYRRSKLWNYTRMIGGLGYQKRI